MEKKARCEAEHALQVIRNPSAKHESGGLVYDTRARRVKVFSDKPDAPRFLLFNSGRCVLRVFFSQGFSMSFDRLPEKVRNRNSLNSKEILFAVLSLHYLAFKPLSLFVFFHVHTN